MIEFSSWVKSVGGGYRAAEILGTNQPQVQRWKKAGAVIAPDGRIFIEVSASYTHLDLRNKKTPT